jgi:TatD DNase family protein
MIENTEVRGFADAHMHIADVAEQDGYRDIGNAALLLSCTATRDQWEVQRRMAAADSRIRPFYGIHPWFAAGAPDGWSEDLRMMLEDDERAGVGETGIDRLHPDVELQLRVFVGHAALAAEFDRPLNVHLIRTEAETLRAVREHAGGVPVILHSYTGDPGHVPAFAAENCYFSLSWRIMRLSDLRRYRLLAAIPDDRLLVETDAPVKERDFRGMGGFLHRLARLKSMETEELVELTLANTRRVLG